MEDGVSRTRLQAGAPERKPTAAQAGVGAAASARSRRAGVTSRWRRPKASAKRKAIALRKHGEVVAAAGLAR